MSHFATQLVALGIAHLPPGLFGRGDKVAAVASADRLSASPSLGFEFRIGEEGPVDLSQRYRIADDGIAHLRWLGERHGGADGSPWSAAWRRVADLADLWAGDEALIKEIWLEIDADGPPYPSMFVYFGCPVAHDPAVRRALEALSGGLGASWLALCAALDAAAALRLEPGRLVGLMLSRSGALRATFKRPGADGARRLLEHLAWRGPTALVTDILAEPLVHRTLHQLVLDFTPDLLPTCGIELLSEEGGASGWMSGSLDWMVERGWADPARIAGIADWTGPLAPSMACAPWPDAMIVRSMVDDAVPTAWWRTSNHLKLNISPDRPPLAKAYLGLCAGAPA